MRVVYLEGEGNTLDDQCCYVPTIINHRQKFQVLIRAVSIGTGLFSVSIGDTKVATLSSSS